jgi:hypothetical protein
LSLLAWRHPDFIMKLRITFHPWRAAWVPIDDAKGRAWIVERGLDQHRVRGAALVSSGS